MDKNQITEWVGKHYLLIDDFPSMRQMLRDMLRALGAKYIDQTGSGAEAITLLGKNKYDVVLCDYNIGTGKNG